MSNNALVKKDLPVSGEVVDQPISFSPEMLIAKAIEHNLPIDALEKLFALRDRLREEEGEERRRLAKAAFDQALSDFQAECPAIVKRKAVYNKNSNVVRYRYAPLGDIISQVRDLLGKHGFSYRFPVSQLDRDTQEMVVVCVLSHKQGHEEPTERRFPLSKNEFMSPEQNSSKLITFASRSAFCGALGIVTTEEEEEPAEHPDTPPPARPTPASPPAQQPPPLKSSGQQLPINGVELRQRLGGYDTKLSSQKVCGKGELLAHVAQAGVSQGWSDDLTTWDRAEQIQFAVEETKRFEAKCRSKPVANKTAPWPNEPTAEDQDGIRLYNWLRGLGQQAHREGSCTDEDDLLTYVKAEGIKDGCPREVVQWKGDQIRRGVECAKRWVLEHKQKGEA